MYSGSKRPQLYKLKEVFSILTETKSLFSFFLVFLNILKAFQIYYVLFRETNKQFIEPKRQIKIAEPYIRPLPKPAYSQIFVIAQLYFL